MIRIPLISHDKIGGRPLRVFAEADLGAAVLPAIENGDVLVMMEEDATGIALENDILLVRPVPEGTSRRDIALKPGMLIAWRYGDAIWPVRIISSGSHGIELQEPPEARHDARLRAAGPFGHVLAVIHHPPVP